MYCGAVLLAQTSTVTTLLPSAITGAPDVNAAPANAIAKSLIFMKNSSLKKQPGVDDPELPRTRRRIGIMR